MKKNITFIWILFMCLLGCDHKPVEFKLEENSPAYILGKELSDIFPILDPAVNRVMVKSNDFVITAGEVLQSLTIKYGNRTENFKTLSEEPLKVIIQKASTQLVHTKLLLKEAQKNKIKISPTQIDSALEAQYARAGGERAFLDYIDNSGLDFESVKQDLLDNLYMQDHINSVVKARSQVTDEQIQRYYQKYTRDTTASVRQILLRTENKSEAEKKQIRAKMQMILKRAREGDDFAALVGEYSEDTTSKENGGLSERFPRGITAEPFEDAAFSIPIGGISDIIETEWGYHILKVIDRGPGDKSFEEIEPFIRKKVFETEYDLILPAYMKELVSAANVEYVDY
jgi:parvulin-like peptidyl-prolyl isomerase